MAEDLERMSIADVKGESTDDKHPIDIDVGLFGAGSTEAIVADLDGESLAEDDQQEVDDDGVLTRLAAADSGVEPIGGYRAEWRPNGGESDTFDPTDLRAGADGSYGAGATDAPVDVADDADPPDDDVVDVIGGNYDEPTEIWLGPAEGGDDAVTEVSDTDAPLAAQGGDDLVTEVSDTDAPLAATDSTRFEDVD
ncbi:MAG: hypothetical protein ACR2IR_11060 [Acidimicrobiia bacterium]